MLFTLNIILKTTFYAINTDNYTNTAFDFIHTENIPNTTFYVINTVYYTKYNILCHSH